MTTPDILCIGSVLWDIIGRTPRSLACGDDVPGRITRLPGGVALNLAMTFARLGLRPAVLTAIGQDAEGAELIAAVAALGIETAHALRPSELPTDRYMGIEDASGLFAAIADAHSLEAAGARILAPLSDGRLGTLAAPWSGPVALDGNLTQGLLAQVATSPLFRAADLRVAPASPGKAERLLALVGHPAATLYLNRAEAALILGHDPGSAGAAATALVGRGVRRVLVTDGPAAAAEATAERLIVRTPPAVAVTRVTGAGDTFMAAHIVAETRGAAPEAAFDRALAVAAAYVSGKDAA